MKPLKIFILCALPYSHITAEPTTTTKTLQPKIVLPSPLKVSTDQDIIAVPTTAAKIPKPDTVLPSQLIASTHQDIIAIASRLWPKTYPETSSIDDRHRPAPFNEYPDRFFAASKLENDQAAS